MLKYKVFVKHSVSLLALGSCNWATIFFFWHYLNSLFLNLLRCPRNQQREVIRCMLKRSSTIRCQCPWKMESSTFRSAGCILSQWKLIAREYSERFSVVYTEIMNIWKSYMWSWTGERRITWRKIIAVVYTTYAVAKRNPQKIFRLVWDSNPWPLRYQCSSLPIKLTSQLGAARWIGSR